MLLRRGRGPRIVPPRMPILFLPLLILLPLPILILRIIRIIPLMMLLRLLRLFVLRGSTSSLRPTPAPTSFA